MSLHGLELRVQKLTHIYGQLIFKNDTKTVFSGRRIIFSTNGPGSTGYPHKKE